MTPAPATASRLSAEQARRLADAEVAVGKLDAQLAIAKATRDELRESYLPRIPLSEDAQEAAKGIRVALAGGVIVRVAPVPARESFSLRRYVELGHQITAAMRDAIATGAPGHRWTVKPQAGPKKIGAVDPA